MNRRSFLVVLAILSLLAGCGQNMISRGRGLVEAKQYGQAQELFYKLIRDDPSNPVLWRELGISFYKERKLDKAVVALNNAIPLDVPAFLYLGLVHEAMNDPNQAIDDYLIALRLYPNSRAKGLIFKRLDVLLKEQMAREIPILLNQESDIGSASIDSQAVAVLSFDPAGLEPDLAPLAMGMAELVAVDLAKVRSLRCIERMRIGAIMNELRLAQMGVTDGLSAPQIGRLLGARKLITGKLTSYGQRLRLDGEILDVVKASPSFPEPSEARLDEFYAIQKKFVFTVLDTLGVGLSLEEREAILKRPTESYLAFLAYCRGLSLQSQGSYSAAQVEFKKAADLDPGFTNAQEELGLTNSVIDAGDEAGDPIAQLGDAAQDPYDDPGTDEDPISGSPIDILGSDPGSDAGNSTADNDPELSPVGTASVRGTLHDD